jgi:hypothetical protein
VSGDYITAVRRAKEILSTKVDRGGFARRYDEVVFETMELGKKMFYFARGDNMKYISSDTIWNKMPYYYPGFTPDSMAVVISTFIKDRKGVVREGFENVKTKTDKEGRVIYSAEDAKLFWSRWASFQLAKWLYQAIKENITLRHSKQ